MNPSWTNHPLLSLFLFLLVVFVYIHIVAQWKKSEDLEIYEMDYVNATHLHEICSVKQPVMFEFIHNPEFYHRIQLSKMEKFDNYDVKLKDIRDYWKPVHPESTAVDYVVLPFHSAQKLMESDTNSRYISEGNSEFMEITGLEYVCSSMDAFLKPHLHLYSKYDLMMGSKHATTPLRYHTHACYFVTPTSGKIRVKMTPWKSSRYLHPVKDYDQYEFRSTVNIWNPASNHQNDMDKLRFLDFEVQVGYILSIPPYWWYSIRYSTDSGTCVCSITYDTVANAAAHSYDWVQYYLQQNRGKKTRDTTDTEIALSLAPLPGQRDIHQQDPVLIPQPSTAEPGTSTAEPGTSTVEPGTSKAEPGTSTVEPGTSTVEPGTSKADPMIHRPTTHATTPEKKEIITNAGIYQVV